MSTEPQPRRLSGLSEIAADYDLILCDVWGVIHNGRENFPRGCEALSRFQAMRGEPVVLISNSPRPSDDVRAQLHALLVPDHAFSGFVTSGDATRAELKKRAPGPVFAIGPGRDGTLYDGTGLALCGIEDAAFLSVTGLVDDEAETPEDYRAVLTLAASRGLELVCANPDIVVHRGTKLIYCAGALAALYRELGGRVVMAGKPHAPIYELALETAAALRGQPADRRRILAIGDGLPTDVAGALDQGIDCLFVSSGIHGDETVGADGALDLDRVSQLLGRNGLTSTYVLPHLVW